MSGWEVGPATIATRNGDIIVPAWVSGEFSLDQRFDVDGGDAGWAVSHRNTGMLVRIIIGKLEKAQEFVAEIEKLGAWDFTAPEDCKQYSSGVKVALERFDHSGSGGWGIAA